MKTITCPNCQNSGISMTSKFCGECGNRIACECGAILNIKDKFCQSCGKSNKKFENQKNNHKNRFVFSEDKDGRKMEAEFSDNATKDLADTLRDVLVANQLGSKINNSLSKKRIELPESEPSKVDDWETEVSELVADNEVESIDSTAENVDVNYPSINLVTMRNLPANETEWILVYSFYASNFGKKIFTRGDIMSCYDKSNRKTSNRVKNLSSYIKRAVQKGAINPLNNKGEFSLLEEGLQAAEEIVKRSKSSPVKAKSSSKVKEGADSKKNDSGKRISLRTKLEVLELGIGESQRQKLREFVIEKLPKSQEDLVLVLGYWLSKEMNINEFGINEIYTAVQIVDEKTPRNLGQVFINLKGSGRLTKNKASKKYSLNHVGDDFVKFKLPKS
ncbi:zinc ribbon domain-containing protein [uncultured Arcticibacterium sp.]|uniref:zinc ribbon domain-containing protein n=1 Tax=uncultured Arcticibacterium sp. TaxID=2173042 RepID=UPI0030F6E906